MIQSWFPDSFQLVVLVLVLGFSSGLWSLFFLLESFFFFLLVLFLGRSLFFMIDCACNNPHGASWSRLVSYHEHVETETGRPDGVETKRSSFVSAFSVFKLKKSWLFSRISNLLCVGRGRTRHKICSRSNIRKNIS